MERGGIADLFAPAEEQEIDDGEEEGKEKGVGEEREGEGVEMGTTAAFRRT